MVFSIGWRGLWPLLLCGCAGAPGALDLPPLQVEVSYRPALGGASPADAELAPKSLTIGVFALRRSPLGGSIEAATLAISAEEDAPFRVTSSLPPGCRWLDATATAAWSAGVADSAAPVDQTTDPTLLQRLGVASCVVLPTVETVVHTSLPMLPHLCIGSGAHGSRLQIDAQPTGERAPHRILMRDPLPDTGSCLLFVPDQGQPARRDGIAGYALVVTAEAPPGPDTVAAAMAEARAAADRQAAVGTAVERQAGHGKTAVGEHNRRPALLAIARQLDLPQCVDALLTADEPLLIAMGTATANTKPTDTAYAWQFERGVWLAMLPALQRDELPLGPRACLLRHFGTLTADANGLLRCLTTSADATAFAVAVREENLYALASHDPILRVRAHEWLTERSAAVVDFDPMADADGRRLALRRHAAAAAATQANEPGVRR